MPIKKTTDGARQLALQMLSSDSLEKLYDEKAINYTGKPIGSEESYQEIFARAILDVLKDDKIPRIRKSGLLTYCEKERIDKPDIPDYEEKVQRDFFFFRRLLDKQYGIPIWFELQAWERGKGKGIDLVYHNPENNILHIFELKYNNKKDTLLHGILELQTYFQRVNWTEAQRDLRGSPRGSNMILPAAEIKKHLLIDTQSFNNFPLNYMYSAGGSVEKLMKKFEIDIVLY